MKANLSLVLYMSVRVKQALLKKNTEYTTSRLSVSQSS